MCRKVTKNRPNICNWCFKRLEGIFANDSDSMDGALASILRIGMKHHRDQAIRSLANTTSKPNDKVATALETLRKENKVMK